MNWFKNHVDSVLVISVMFSGFLWMNGKFNDIERRLAKIETVLIVKGICGSDALGASKDKK